jgi:polyferredoxin/Pyruvate/2-oxoacid:ferredoxin oxidoreductase delta subunit
MEKLRRVVQVGFLAFFVILFLIARYPYSGKMEADLFLRFSPLLPLFHFIQDLSLSWVLWPALVILVATPFLGRFFCGWICPLGTTIDAASKIVKSPSNRVSGKWEKLRFLKFALLVACILLAMFSVHVWGYLDPLSIFNRALTVVFYPLGTLFVNQTLLASTKVPFLETPAFYVYDLFKASVMPEMQAHPQQFFWIALFIGAILGAEKLSRRFWCRNVCPAGAWLGFLAQFRMFERIVGEACPICNKCQTECKMNAIPTGDVKHTSKVECIDCFNCGAVCPPKINAITYRWRWKPYHTPVDFTRRQLLRTTAGGAIALGMLSVGLKNRDAKDRQVRPPGALPEDQFADKCIRCQECVRICASNGGCLQPDGIQSTVLDLWLPVAVMREGYCEYNCNLCGQVCPTDAIMPITLEQKQHTPIGLAHFDKNHCIPYAQNSDCIVCEEHCPTPDKAIKFESKEVRLRDGNTMMVKYPFVLRELCIGCGICETKCPLPGQSAVFVTTENQRRAGVPLLQPQDQPASPYG